MHRDRGLLAERVTSEPSERVRGSSPLWWDWEGGRVPYTESLVDALLDIRPATTDRRQANAGERARKMPPFPV